MIDIVFLLIAFFMIVSDLSKLSVQEVVLPVAPEAVTPQADPKDKEVTINIVLTDAETGEAEVRFMGELDALDVDGLTAKFNAELAAYPIEDYPEMWEENPNAPGQMNSRLKVLVRCDEGASSGPVQEVWRACQNAKIYRVRVAALSERSSSPYVAEE